MHTVYSPRQPNPRTVEVLSGLRCGQSLLCLAAVFLVFVGSARGQSSPQIPAKVQLVLMDASTHPTGHFWVGVLFQLDPGWHIYWQNPGDSGEFPKIQWKLPVDWNAGQIRWPRPILLGHGSVRDYGYEGQVLLMTTVQPTDPVTAPVELGATVRYIVCREICIPAKADVTLSLPSTKLPNIEDSEWRGLFEKTLALLPKPLPTSCKVSAVSSGKNLILTIHGASAAQKMRFFPLDPGVIENAAPQALASDEKGFQLTLKKSDHLLKQVSTLRGLLVLDEDRAYEIAVRVKSS